MRKLVILSLSAVLFLPLSASAQTITTAFNTSDGFVTGPINGAAPAAGAFDPVTLSDSGFDVIFSGGQQLQSFDGPSYQGGPAAYFFVNTGGGAATFTGSFGSTITGGANNGDSNGLIEFGGFGASEVSFFAADRANGAASALNVFGTDGSLLQGGVTIPSGVVSDFFFEFTESALGAPIGSIGFDLAGPAANPPYVVAIDTFSATAAVPEPSSALLLGGLALVGLRRSRRS